MGVIKGFLSTDLIGRLVLILLLVAQLFNWLSMCMNDWGLYDIDSTNDRNKLGFGVWKRCGNQEPDPNCVDIDGWRLTWYGAFQGFAIIAFLSTNVSFCFTIMLIYVPQCSGKKDLAVCCAVACFVTVVFYIVAIIIFGVKFDRTFDAGFDREILMTGFYFAIIVVVLSLISGICLVYSLAKGRQVGPSGGGATSGGDMQQKQQQQQQEQMQWQQKQVTPKRTKRHARRQEQLEDEDS